MKTGKVTQLTMVMMRFKASLVSRVVLWCWMQIWGPVGSSFSVRAIGLLLDGSADAFDSFRERNEK
jgi:hypothetical protein